MHWIKACGYELAALAFFAIAYWLGPEHFFWALIAAGTAGVLYAYRDKEKADD